MRFIDFILAYLTIIIVTMLMILVIVSTFYGCGIEAPVSPTIQVVPPGVIDSLVDIGCVCPELDLTQFVLVPKL